MCISLVVTGLLVAPVVGGDVVVVTPTADSFCRQSATTRSYGAAGALCVAGTNSVNGSGSARGRFDTMIKFPMAATKTAFDAQYGAGNWRLATAKLTLSEVDQPVNTIFPRGVGEFDVIWFSNDNWTEGPGTPNSVVTGTGTQITWSYLSAISPGAVQQPLGRFQNMGVFDLQTFTLTPSAGLAADVEAGTVVSLRFSPVTSTLGFTFHSRNYGNPDQHPQLALTAAPRLPGDMNCDGLLNNFDIDPFVIAIVDPESYVESYPGCSLLIGDMNLDGQLNNFDIDLFIECIVNGCRN
ncbi:MAG: hypothetical protein IPM64_14800 [Phycisphaerales bacterium]|nr:hypothetical protein [Phycisphaerales bacterium]